jgi:MFS family permease
MHPRLLTTNIPARLERLPWGRFHTLVVAAVGHHLDSQCARSDIGRLGGGRIEGESGAWLSDPEIDLAGSAYLPGAVIGALFFGWLTDRLGRRKLFFITIAVYLTATALTGASWNAWSFFLFRFLIGGEYAAINSTIQELVPARYRGFTDLVINGGFWVGAALGAIVAVALLNPALIDPETGWRLAFLVGAALGMVVFVMRMWIPESPPG